MDIIKLIHIEWNLNFKAVAQKINTLKFLLLAKQQQKKPTTIFMFIKDK